MTHASAAALGLVLVAVLVPGQPTEPAGETARLGGDGIEYLVTLPDGFAAEDSRSWPLLLFLHGGDRSNTRHHPAKHAAAAGIDLPFVVIAPHCTGGCTWSAVDFDALLEEASSRPGIDRSRVYLTGYSMGGYGAWSALAKAPAWFAAAAPIAGGGDPASICAARSVPVRAYHAEGDGVVPASASREMVEALTACGGEAELVLYPGDGHGSWIPTFRDPDFYAWLLSHRRPSP